ncbi:MAG: DUF817 domain-containing protein [Rhodobacter sp.]|nr:DUF817 domain-containing protein [Rhodobacter sp.]
MTQDITGRARSTREIEDALTGWTRRHVPRWLAETCVIVLKLGWASLFAVLILAGIIVSKLVWSDAWPIYRYDALVIYAVATQVLFLAFRLETWDEAKVILLFHISGTVMEYFKVSAGSWAYPEPGYLKVLSVPLFTGFMYASVGSFIARAIRLFDMRFAPYPPFWASVLLAVAIYVNFFAHHFLPDIRIVLFAGTVLLFGRTRVWFHIGAKTYWVPMVLAAVLTAFALWVAENVGTRTGTWAYPGQTMFALVSWGKMGSWYLLIFVSFVTVTLVFREALVTPEKPGLAARQP